MVRSKLKLFRFHRRAARSIILFNLLTVATYHGVMILRGRHKEGLAAHCVEGKLSEILGRDVKALDVSISKELEGVASMGGMGAVVRAIGMLSLDIGHSSVVIMPRYRGITRSVYASCVTFRLKSKFIRVDVFHAIEETTSGQLHVFLVDHSPHLGNSWPHFNDNLYKCISWQERDLAFSLAAAHVVKQLVGEVGSTVVQIHGLTNAPSILFTRLLTNVSVLYRTHDYMDEVHLSYDYGLLNDYVSSIGLALRSTKNSIKHGLLCDSEGSVRMPSFQSPSSAVYAYHLIVCADIVSPVSQAMISHLVTNEGGLRAFEILAKGNRLMPVGNWISEDLQQLAMQLHKKHTDPSLVKAEAARVLFPEQNCVSDKGSYKPTFLWIGRFEVNKGSNMLAPLAAILCEYGANFVIIGNPKTSRVLQELQRLQKCYRDCGGHVLLLSGSDQHDKARRDLARLSADVAIIPSKEEAFGLTAAEALLFGTIPIISNVGGLVEIVSVATLRDLTCDGLKKAVFTGLQVPYFDDPARFKFAFSFAIFEAIQLLDSLRGCGIHDSFLKRLAATAPVRFSSLATKSSTDNYERYKKMLMAAHSSCLGGIDRGCLPGPEKRLTLRQMERVYLR